MVNNIILKLNSALIITLLFIPCTSYSFQTENNPYSFLENESEFTVTPALEIMISFWKDIYTKYPKSKVVIHDRNNLDIIYEVFDTGHYQRLGYSNRNIWKVIGRHKLKYKRTLRYIYRNRNKPQLFAGDTLKIYNMYKSKNLLTYTYRASNNIRCQEGLSKRFKQGLIVSGRYLPYILKIFEKEGIPHEFAILPHIESSFNYKAYSKYGASGLWQFTRSTGRRYLAINYIIDERRDPIKSTEGIARLFKYSYSKLGDWKLSILSHIYGINGTLRAVRTLKTKNIETIIQKHRGRIFGFASKNFYPEFLAAKEVVKNHEKYFGKIEFEKPLEFNEFTLPDYLAYSVIKKHFNLQTSSFSELNPALLRPVFQGESYIPKGFTLKIPVDENVNVASLYKNIPEKDKHRNQRIRGYYRVRRGENLSYIAKNLKVNFSDLIRVNNIKNPNKIRIGQRLKIPAGLSYSSYKPSRRVTVQANSEDESVSTIYVKDNETLSHFADWSHTPVRYTLEINNLSSRSRIHYGQKIIIHLSKVSEEEFLEEREEFHKEIEDNFFNDNRIKELKIHTVAAGENIWYIVKKFNTPLWLVEKHNENKFLSNIKRGDRINIPIIEKITDAGTDQ